MMGKPTLLKFNPSIQGGFEPWLEKLGLKDFLKDYPVTQLVEWGWLRPVCRVVFPNRFFDQWEDYPFGPNNLSPDLSDYAALWDYYWDPDDPIENLWFLDPIFRTDESLAKLLKSFDKPEVGVPAPSQITHSSGREIYPYVDYFYPWQGFALIDIIRSADCFHKVLRTPDMRERAADVVKTADYLSNHPSAEPGAVLVRASQWGGLAEPMTWLAHLRSFKNALYVSRSDGDLTNIRQQYERGARALADYLGVTELALSNVIVNKLLVLAHSWRGFSKSSVDTDWTKKAWVYLCDEIQLAMTWLILLSGKPFPHFVEKWKSPDFGDLGRLAIDEVLPYRFLEHEKSFARVVPYYFKNFNELQGNGWALNESKLVDLCRRIRKRNYPFGGFLAAFHELHDSLSYKPFDENGIDFRELRPIDHFAMLAIHAEGCLRRELDANGLLSSLKGSSQTLSRYIEELAKLRRIPTRIIGRFCEWRSLADLKTDRDDPVGRIKSLTTGLPEKEHLLLQGFLCCILARNYFAHHDFLDGELLSRTPKPAFLLSGILLTVLTLLNAGDDGRAPISGET